MDWFKKRECTVFRFEFSVSHGFLRPFSCFDDFKSLSDGVSCHISGFCMRSRRCRLGKFFDNSIFESRIILQIYTNCDVFVASPDRRAKRSVLAYASCAVRQVPRSYCLLSHCGLEENLVLGEVSK